MTEEIKTEIISQLQSLVMTDEEIQFLHLSYDDDHSYAYGQRAGLEHAIEIINDIFNDYGF